MDRAKRKPQDSVLLANINAGGWGKRAAVSQQRQNKLALVREDGTAVTSNTDIESTMHAHFHDKFCDNSQLGPPDWIYTMRFDSTGLRPSLDELAAAILQLPTGKSCAQDLVVNEMLRALILMPSGFPSDFTVPADFSLETGSGPGGLPRVCAATV